MKKGVFRFLVIHGLETRLRAFMQLDKKLTEMDYIRLLFVVNFILYYKVYFPEIYNGKGVAINRNKLSETLCVNHAKASRILKHLLSWQILDKVTGFWQGSHSRGFRLNVQWEASPVSFRSFRVDDVYFIEKLVSLQGERLKEPLLNSQYTLLRDHVRVDINGLNELREKYNNSFLNTVLDAYQDGEEVDVDFNSLFSNIDIDGRDIGLLSFIIKHIYVERPDTASRIYTNLGNLVKEHRKYLLLNGKPLLMTDLVNSQVVFSVALIERTHRMIKPRPFDSIPKDMASYKELALSGRFYEELAKEAGLLLTEANRGEFKKAFFREVFFSQIRSKGGRIRKAFRRMFPSVIKVINHIKQDDYADFAIQLQRKEAYVFIDVTLAEMIKRKKMALSIHDSIVVSTMEDLELAERLIKLAMNIAYRLTPRFKREG